MFCMYNYGRRLDVKSVSIKRLLKYGVCSYTDGQVSKLNTVFIGHRII